MAISPPMYFESRPIRTCKVQCLPHISSCLTVDVVLVGRRMRATSAMMVAVLPKQVHWSRDCKQGHASAQASDQLSHMKDESLN